MATMGPKKSRSTSGASGANDMQAVASLAVLAKVHAEAKSDADAGLLNIIQEHEAAFLAWDATGTEDGLSEGSPEDRAAYAAETLLIFAPCRSYADVRAKIGYIYHRQTAAAQDAYDAVVGREDDFLGFLGSLIGIEAPGNQSTADRADNDMLINVIQAYRTGVKAYADHPEFSSHDEENEVAEVTYGVHADKLDKWDAPATSREEAMEALRFALEDAAQWCGSVTTSTMIKAALGYLEGGERVPGGGASTGRAVATASPTIPEMYEEWLAVRDAPSDRTDEEMDGGLSRYQILQARIIAAEPQTPRDVAIMFIVDTDDGESHSSDIFEARVRDLAAATTVGADPLLSAIEAYRAKVSLLAETDTSHCASIDEENEAFYAIYGAEQDVLTEAAPMPTSIAGVREAIRLALEEDAICDRVAEGPLRAALAYLDGRAA